MSMMEELCRLLEECAHIIRKQAELLAMHGIQTEDGEIEAARSRVIGGNQRELLRVLRSAYPRRAASMPEV